MDARAKSTINGLLRRFKLKDDEHLAELIEVPDVHVEATRKAKEEARKWKMCCVFLLLYIFHRIFSSGEKEVEI
ncbi:hypothetical protein DCAR_0934996 [Daucus carota subsp. sativus]|uniref:Uncharacterized protein n=1 Tax=Daucus carota subsp. sativus TaxID=79200 RepID=A0A175YFY8_DAUCS|nr:hypothetical protein DCAR_0934996 [Daucus carota subsp. sativus]